ncbi:MAG: amino acid ABC transporter substrate-binding protein [Candidatus Symbiobacter sp.]|nr:amino acid ABC transporter substrate-binding protein [Candidatus Symbiobacter sp.]
MTGEHAMRKIKLSEVRLNSLIRFGIIGIIGIIAMLMSSPIAVQANDRSKTNKANPAPTNLVEKIKKRGRLHCGVNPASMGFSDLDKAGQWRGMYIDLCRALAVEILGDAEKITYFPLNAGQRFPALQFGEIDVLSWNSTKTLSREATLGIQFAPIIFYDGTQIMVRAKSKYRSVAQMKNTKICLEMDSTTVPVIKEYFNLHRISFTPVIIEDVGGLGNLVADAFFHGKCDGYAIDGSKLASDRTRNNFTESDYIILPEILSKEPLSLAYRKSDPEFGAIVDWTIYALFAAEQYGITKANVDAVKAKTTNPEIMRLLGSEPGMGKALGLGDDWAYKAISTVGNYGEMFDNNIGMNSPLKLARGLNKPFSRGGIMYAPPIR